MHAIGSDAGTPSGSQRETERCPKSPPHWISAPPNRLEEDQTDERQDEPENPEPQAAFCRAWGERFWGNRRCDRACRLCRFAGRFGTDGRVGRTGIVSLGGVRTTRGPRTVSREPMDRRTHEFREMPTEATELLRRSPGSSESRRNECMGRHQTTLTCRPPHDQGWDDVMRVVARDARAWLTNIVSSGALESEGATRRMLPGEKSRVPVVLRF